MGISGGEATDKKAIGILLVVGIVSLLMFLEMVLTKVVVGTFSKVSSGYLFFVFLWLILAFVFIAGGVRQMVLLRKRDSQ